MPKYGTSKYGTGLYGDTPARSAYIDTRLNPDRRKGYDIFIKAGMPAVPGVDLPVIRIGSDLDQVTIAESDLDLQPETT